MSADSLLVDHSQAGDRSAFAEIVAKYQTLVCSIAYGMTGNLSVSEELAQETFVAAWRSIADLRDPVRLRPWLCGIVRNLARNSARRRQHDVLRNAHPIEQTHAVEDHGLDPVDKAIAQEEADLLDRTLTNLPESYREPLVLYYREQQSVARVAEQLELSTDAVKQRLARGREMLRTEVAAVVERGLRISAPGRAFTLGVLAALPVMTGTAKAATITATAAHGITAMKAAGGSGLVGMILGPLAGLLGSWFGYSMSIKTARSERERAFIRRMTLGVLALVVVLTTGLTLLLLLGGHLAATNPVLLTAGIATLVIAYVMGLLGTIIVGNRRIAQIRREDGTQDVVPPEVTANLPAVMRELEQPRVYQSPVKFLGLPLVSIQLSGGVGPKRKSAVGWIAIGDKACGVLFASGSIAVGGIAVGGVSIGLVAFGGLALGLLALGGAAIGFWAIGGAAIGWLAFGGLAVAGKAAIGGCALARDFAVGGIAAADQSNTELAKKFVAEQAFFEWGGMLMTPWGWWILVAVLMLPTFVAMRFAERRRRGTP